MAAATASSIRSRSSSVRRITPLPVECPGHGCTLRTSYTTACEDRRPNASAGHRYADPTTGGSGRHEPMILTIRYGDGRVFHTPMGHADYSMECVGFIVSLQRGAEWARHRRRDPRDPR